MSWGDGEVGKAEVEASAAGNRTMAVAVKSLTSKSVMKCVKYLKCALSFGWYFAAAAAPAVP